MPVDGKLLFNVGSVGNPMDLIPLAGYAILTGSLDRSATNVLTIEIVRLPYDIGRAIQEARIVDMPKMAEYEFELHNANHRSYLAGVIGVVQQKGEGNLCRTNSALLS